MTDRRRMRQLFLYVATLVVWITPLSVDCFVTLRSSVLPDQAVPFCRHQESNRETKLRSQKEHASGSPHSDEEENVDFSRRRAFQNLALATVAIPVAPALAGKAEYDKVTGGLYTPKAEMLSGGSTAARGIGLSPSSSTSRTKLQPGQALQTVYETRFITYLSRFLINFDPAANAWWVQNVGLVDTWDLGSGSSNTFRQGLTRDEVDVKFAEFAGSVEIGLADYFVGPYGSYGSLKAARAGIDASYQARSSRSKDTPPAPFDIFGTVRDLFSGNIKQPTKRKTRNSDGVAKQGILNLYTLLKARYISNAAKKQLAILFSFFSDGDLQPTAEIQSLLGEADNATVSKIDWIRPYADNEATSRTSSRQGGGYSRFETPKVMVDPSPALGSVYTPAKAQAVMKATSRVLRLRLVDGGEGYETAPDVVVSAKGTQRACSAVAILDRDGQVNSILVLDPGYGYGKSKKQEPPKVTIASPPSKTGRRATAVAELEYEVVEIDLTEGGDGYVITEPPQVEVSPPKEDPDWYLENTELRKWLRDSGPVRAEVSQMVGPSGNLAVTGYSEEQPAISTNQLRRDPVELLPSTIRPQRNNRGEYVIPQFAAVPTFGKSPNPRYRTVDPLFGPIGSLPVTKSAMELSTSEYARLALSGAVCTVLVRTALNPLELIKTKQQLQNDEELLTFAREQFKAKKALEKEKNPKMSTSGAEEEREGESKIGSSDLIASLVELRGFGALFQSADITFLASLMFGSFGFGATELFRRYFGSFNEGGGGTNPEVVLLLAATVATIITSFFAAPFELLRVRSMGLVKEMKWTEVLGDFLNEKAEKSGGRSKKTPKSEPGSDGQDDEFRLSDLSPQDVLPLWAGFPPTASRELLFAIPKFLAFDILATAITGFFNDQAGPGSLPIQVGVGTAGLAISAIAGAVAGLAGALVSHPADLILTYTSASKKKKAPSDQDEEEDADWRAVVKDLLAKEGGIANLFVGLSPRLVFFFLVIGLQFFLYDYVKTLLNVGSDDLSLVLDVFYAVRRGLSDTL